tara:strand:+ start:143 stop:772 length:630 start_codon:yes stop_codon:yes gene_type:complete
MKNTHLKNIIRESIKELINEQSGGIRVRLKTCNGGLQQYKCVPQGSQLGDRFTANMGPGNSPRQAYVKRFLSPPECTGISVTAPQGGCPNCDNENPQQFSCAAQSSGCDTTTSSPCAQQWWQNPNATWAANWITNRDCTSYNWPAQNLENQANTIMAGAPNPQTGPYNNASDIWSAANNSGLVNPQKGQFIGKMAKAKYSQCQIQACNC